MGMLVHLLLTILSTLLVAAWPFKLVLMDDGGGRVHEGVGQVREDASPRPIEFILKIILVNILGSN